jgi:hypothetical protein
MLSSSSVPSNVSGPEVPKILSAHTFTTPTMGLKRSNSSINNVVLESISGDDEDVNDVDDASRLLDGIVPSALFFRVLLLKNANIFGILMNMNLYS